MRRSAPIVWLVTTAFILVAPTVALAGDECIFDPTLGDLVCSESGVVVSPGRDARPTPDPALDPGKRYVYTGTDPVIGPCYSWSNVPGGLDAWDPANDGAVIAITTSLPLCPTADPLALAWSIFRSWDLDPPAPSITPTTAGITGIPTQLSVTPPQAIIHTEVMPDGRTLEVRAQASLLIVDWGDGTITRHPPTSATGYPDGAASHAYGLKTCSAEYRNSHPSGGLCHPSAEFYPIAASYEWTGEFSVGSGWVRLGTLTVTAPAVPYDVDEAIGVVVP